MKIWAHRYSRTVFYIERFSVVLGHFPKESCAKYLLVTIAGFLRKWASTLALGIFSISEINRIKNNTVSIRYISINFDKRINRKRSPNSLLLRDNTQRTRNILKVHHVCINGGFKLLVILPYIIVDDLNGELFLWTTTVVLMEVCSVEIAKAIILITITIVSNSVNIDVK